MKALEFYSGLGGMHYSLLKSGISAHVVEAFEINEVANDVYEFNFKRRPSQGNIQRLTVKQLDHYAADIWLMSPPCQPYTRQGLKKDAADGRAKSFLHTLGKLPQMACPPSYIFVENVVGFETSVSHKQLIASLAAAEFQVQEFVLSPLQFGIPYSRPRYFCLAKRRPLIFSHVALNGGLLYNPRPLLVPHQEWGDCKVCSESFVRSPAQTEDLPFLTQSDQFSSSLPPPRPANGNLPPGSDGAEPARQDDGFVSEEVSAEEDAELADSEESSGGRLSEEGRRMTRAKLRGPDIDPACRCQPVGDFLVAQPEAVPLDAGNLLVSGASADQSAAKEQFLAAAKESVTERIPGGVEYSLADVTGGMTTSRDMNHDLLPRGDVSESDICSDGSADPWEGSCSPLEASDPGEAGNFLKSSSSVYTGRGNSLQKDSTSPSSKLGRHDMAHCGEAPEDHDTWRAYRVPPEVYERWGEVMDIVTRDSQRCCCFTKSYVKFAKGTGSVLATQVEGLSGGEAEDLRASVVHGSSGDSGAELEWRGVPLSKLGLRYFTPQEVANVHSFPPEFAFPEHVSLKQRYAMLGNSLSVAVVAPLLRYLLTS